MRRITPVALTFASLLLIFFTVTGNHGLLQLRKINNEIAAYSNKSTHLESEINQLKDKINFVKEDPLTLERAAREELGLSRPDELVYVFGEGRARLKSDLELDESPKSASTKTDEHSRRVRN